MDTLEAESTVTKRGQTTLPSAILKILKLTKAKDRLVYRVLQDGSVTLSKKQTPDDPIIAAFLDFIAADSRKNPASLRPVTPELLTGLEDLVQDVEFHLDARLSPDDE